ncbi:MAG: 50S ribosomal protein L21 [Clostridiaceae bacterium]|jgi:large subunit ribosomal protein L21|nr:50S ribosomal protein L21 [Clostridiaceae bacterium]
MTSYAIIQTGGKQYRVSEGDEIFIETIEGEPDSDVEFTDVLAVSDGKTLRTGTPILEGAVVRGKIVKHGRGKKIVVFKYKPKKQYRRKMGHRQPYTRVLIEAIEG